MESHYLIGGDVLDGEMLGALCQRYGAEYQRGKVIVHEHDPSTELYFVVRGAVEFSVWDADAGRRLLGRAGRGTLFGEVSCFGGAPRSATATAVEESLILRFDRPTALRLVETSPRFALRIIQTLSERLRAATTRRETYSGEVVEDVAESRRPLTIREALSV